MIATTADDDNADVCYDSTYLQTELQKKRYVYNTVSSCGFGHDYGNAKSIQT